jgi:LuxR family transcriptional regulator, maltose regulon positive regulatory protein
MAHNTPNVSNGELIFATDKLSQYIIKVDSVEWYEWLEGKKTFHFESILSNFTARFVNQYWYAYHRKQGKLRIAYLGKTQNMTLEKLYTVARKFTSKQYDPRISPALPVETQYAFTKHQTFYQMELHQLLITKFHIPRPRSTNISRGRLLYKLDQITNYKLTIISAPAGFGKTTLLAEWVSTCLQKPSWISLDENDNDLLLFFRYLVTAFCNTQDGFNANCLTMINTSSVPQWQPLMTMLINEIASLPHECFLILENYHLIENPEIHAALSFLLHHQPQQLHVILTSRIESPLSLTDLYIHNEIMFITLDDLKFTFEEITYFFDQIPNHILSAKDIASLEKTTEGWIVALQLAAHSFMRQHEICDFTQYFINETTLLDYIIHEVMGNIPQNLQQFVLETAILDRISISLCDAVLNISDAEKIFKTLIELQLFIFPIDEEGDWYRYHPLFAHLLATYLSQSQPEHVKLLHRRASQWYETMGMTVEAIGHAFITKDFEQIANLIDLTGTTMLLDGKASVLIGWFQQLPQNFIVSRPKLYIFSIWTLILTSQFETVETSLQIAEQMCDGMKHRGASLDVQYADISTHIAIMKAILAINKGNIDKILPVLYQLLETLASHENVLRSVVLMHIGDACFFHDNLLEAHHTYQLALQEQTRVGNITARVITLSSLGKLYSICGRLQEAQDTCNQVIHMAEQTDSHGQLTTLPYAGKAHLVLSSILFERNMLNEALHHAHEGIKLCKQWGNFEYLIEGYILLAAIHKAQNDFSGALAHVMIARRIMDNIYDPFATEQQRDACFHRLNDDILTMNAWISMCQGDMMLVEQWMSQHVHAPVQKNLLIDYSDTITIQYLCMQHDFLQAEAFLDELETRFLATERQGKQIDILALRVILFFHAGKERDAITTLLRALTLAEKEHYMRTFLDKGISMGELLRGIVIPNVATIQGYIFHLLQMYSFPDPNPKKDCSKHISSTERRLSPREVEVLHFIAHGLTNREIADTLVLATGTVKKHVENIYGKLQVNNRAQAIIQAYSLQENNDNELDMLTGKV